MKFIQNEPELVELETGDLLIDEDSGVYIIAEDIEEDEYPIVLVNIETGYIDSAYPSISSVSKNKNFSRHIKGSKLVLSETL
ncbi:hypothetical protein G7L40_20310 [Paenibacillus polymyxa]|uniref:Uncharacterized protein n=1 Tax=Paenibacillus polymyxa TaxID=1406 RepID=A0A378XZ78_PAEPO|nr:hypothetical protein [Paenibacillus polymyxa]MBE7896167.1 hypothetical protein [Paenibacillus polymyxa]MBG9765888.1 hypothetical protein [Paenibacillus polymyxa]MCC3256696.1 hypothetical protein [Paenibacillus polymyxa]QPK54813.1 hypothetical protein G7035_20355 [Paenibacillus polymyxa]QPK59904.1 hypothetical protein G7L40_20310 [Paenibacillus polymyxa]